MIMGHIIVVMLRSVLWLCIQITAGALVDIATYKPEAVAEAGVIPHLVRTLDNQDPKLKVN